jgi:EAL domain-containing protein (putative c-di-GMP-specific phosphodiesterase class I)
MYSAKRFQTGFSKYWAEEDAHSVRNLTLTGDLRRAIEEGQLELAFQPKVSLATGAAIGAEVLCRWNRPDHGYVSPEEFIGHAEQSGLIFPLTEWVLRKAVETAAVWRALGWDLNIAVNLSARLLHHERILSLVTGPLAQWEYPPECLTLEITENALLVNPAHAMIVVSEFAGLGLNVSIDDFGTGYSSLSYLTTLNANELKIDKSFVLGMSRDENYTTVVRSVVRMAHDLNLKVVAEGIETDEVAAALRQFGCDTGQGYLFGKPMLADDFEHWLKSNRQGTPRVHLLDSKRA